MQEQAQPAFTNHLKWFTTDTYDFPKSKTACGSLDSHKHPLFPEYHKIPTRGREKPGSGNLYAAQLQKMYKEREKPVILKVTENEKVFWYACPNKQGILSLLQGHWDL